MRVTLIRDYAMKKNLLIRERFNEGNATDLDQSEVRLANPCMKKGDEGILLINFLITLGHKLRVACYP